MDAANRLDEIRQQDDSGLRLYNVAATKARERVSRRVAEQSVTVVTPIRHRADDTTGFYTAGHPERRR